MITLRLVPYYRAEVTLTHGEVDALMLNSARHYDAACRNAGTVGGFLYGIHNRFAAEANAPDVTVELSAGQLDLLAKICERDGPTPLFCSLVEAFEAIQAKHQGRTS